MQVWPPSVFRAKACNALGCSLPGAWSAPLSLRSAIPVAFERPLAGQTVPLIEEIVVRAGGALPLFGASPMRIYFGATLLADIARAPGDARQFLAPLPQNLGDYEGPVTLGAQVKGADGCWSAREEITVQVSSSLLDDTRWGDVQILADAPIHSVQVDAPLDPSEESSDYTWEFAVASPPPPDSPPPENPTSAQQIALEATWLRLQKVPFGTDEPLLGLRQSDGTYLPPTATAICRIRAARKWKTTRFALDGPVIKARREANGDLLFYALPHIYRLSVAGAQWEKVADLTPFALPGGAFDATLRGNKVLALASGTLYTIDLETGLDGDGPDVSEQGKPYGESRGALWIETLDAAPGGVPSWVRVYGDGAGAALYESWVGLDGIESRKRWTLNQPITRVFAEGAQVIFACGSAIYVWARGLSAPLLEYTHTDAVTFVRYAHLPGDVNALWFGDALGRLYHLDNGGNSELFDDRAFVVRAACEFQGEAAEPRTVAGGDANQVFFEGESDETHNGVFAALLTLGAGETVTALERFVQTPVSGTGDVLTGGTPAVAVDNLLVAVTGEDGSYLLRYQRRERAPLALDGAGLSEIEFSTTLSQVEIVEPEF